MLSLLLDVGWLGWKGFLLYEFIITSLNKYLLMPVNISANAVVEESLPCGKKIAE